MPITRLINCLILGESDLDSAAKASIKGEASELVGLLRKVKQQLVSLRTAAATALDTFAEPVGGHEGNSTYVEMKVQLLMSYIVYLVYYLLLKTRGVPINDHPVVPRLVWISTMLDKLRPVDQRVQYQMSKLLQWAGTQGGADNAAEDAHALKPGDLATGVEDEPEEAEWGQLAAPEEDKKSVQATQGNADGLHRRPHLDEGES